MNVTVPVVMMVALSLVAAPRAMYSDGQVTKSSTARKAQADQVSVLKVEGMT